MPLPTSLSSVIRAHNVRASEEVYTALPAVVETFDPARMVATQKVAVKDVRRSEDGSAVFDEFPLIPDVPVMFPRTGAFILSFPLAPGDGVLLVVSTLEAGAWELSGEAPAEPLNLSRQTLNSCVCFPGWFPVTSLPSPTDASARATSAVLGKDGGVQIQISPTEVKLGGAAASDFVALASLVQTSLDAIREAFNAHTHGGVTTGTGASGTPATPLSAVGPVAATVVKAL